MRRVLLCLLITLLALVGTGCPVGEGDSGEVGVSYGGATVYVKGKLGPGQSSPPQDKPIGVPYYPGGPPPREPTIPATPPTR